MGGTNVNYTTQSVGTKAVIIATLEENMRNNVIYLSGFVYENILKPKSSSQIHNKGMLTTLEGSKGWNQYTKYTN